MGSKLCLELLAMLNNFFFVRTLCLIKLAPSVKAEIATIYIPISFSVLFAAAILKDTGDEGCTT